MLVSIGVGEGKSDGVAQFTKQMVGGQSLSIMTLTKGAHPVAKVEGDKLVIGGQTITFDGNGIVFAKRSTPSDVAGMQKADFFLLSSEGFESVRRSH